MIGFQLLSVDIFVASIKFMSSIFIAHVMVIDTLECVLVVGPDKADGAG